MVFVENFVYKKNVSFERLSHTKKLAMDGKVEIGLLVFTSILLSDLWMGITFDRKTRGCNWVLLYVQVIVVLVRMTPPMKPVLCLGAHSCGLAAITLLSRTMSLHNTVLRLLLCNWNVVKTSAVYAVVWCCLLKVKR